MEGLLRLNESDKVTWAAPEGWMTSPCVCDLENENVVDGTTLQWFVGAPAPALRLLKRGLRVRWRKLNRWKLPKLHRSGRPDLPRLSLFRL